MTMYDLDAGGEVSEFNIYSASNQTCLTGDCSAPPCGSCYTCTLELRLVSARQWFPRTGDLSKQQFLTGLIRRIGSLDLLQQVDRLLQPTLGKDFTHSRSRSNPSLPEDMSTLSSDRALNKVALRKYIFETWEWFANSRYWTKANYMLGLLQMCDVKLLHVIGNLIRTLLLRNKIPDFREAKGMDHDDDNISLNESIYSFKTDEHPELQQLAEIWPEYTIVSPATAPNSLIVQPAQVAASAKSHQAKTGSATKKKHSPRWKVDEDVHTEIEHPAAIIVTTSFQATSGVTHYKDFLRCLPVNLAKFILGFLNKKTLKNCMSVSCHWCYLAKDITRDQLALQCIFNDVMKLQGTAPQNVSIVYANICYIAVPRVDDKGFVFPTQNLKEKLGLEASYSGILTDLIQMEERNIYCGPYNIIVINKHPDPNRVIHYSGGQMVASGSSDRKIRFLDINRTKDISLIIQGHAGSIKALLLCEKRGFVLSGSYDLSIRRWNLKSGSCMNIYRGHTGFITCLKMHKDKFVSAAMDFQAKVWNLEKGKCICSFKHEKPVLSVAISEMYVVSSCEKGLVHVWNIAPPSLVKVLTGHRGPVTCVSFDQWHLVSGSKDGSVMAWSMIGNFSQCLMAFYHPQWVLCVHLLYLRVISGCRDGKIRIFDLRNGNCLRVMRANGRGDPVLSLNLAENRIVINTISNVVQFYFEEITWDYTAPSPIITNIMQQDPFKMAPLRKQPYSYVRAQRMRRIGSTNEKIYHKKENVTEQGLSHHARFLSTRYMQAAQSKRTESLSTASRLLSASEQRTLKRIKKHGLYRPRTPDQIYMTVNAIQNSLRLDETNIHTLSNISVSEDWAQPFRPLEDTGKSLTDTAKKHKVNISSIFDDVEPTDKYTDVKTPITAFELKDQKLNQKYKFHSLNTKCFETKPMITRSKSTLGFADPVQFKSQKNRPQTAHEDLAKKTSHITTGSKEGIQAKSFMITSAEGCSKCEKLKLQQTPTMDPYRNNSCFKLRTAKQQKEYAEKIVVEHNVNQQRKQEKGRANRKAW